MESLEYTQNVLRQTEEKSSESLLKCLKLIESIFVSRNIHLPSIGNAATERIQAVPQAQIDSLTTYYSKYLELCLAAPEMMSGAAEASMVKQALEKWGLRLPRHLGESLEDYIESGYMIEIYDQNGIQLYRNFEFFRNCGYNLFDLATVDWPTLYERPSKINEQIMAKVGECFATGQIIPPGSIQSHILRERYLEARKAFHIEVKYIIPLEGVANPNYKGLISIIKADLIADVEDTQKISYL